MVYSTKVSSNSTICNSCSTKSSNFEVEENRSSRLPCKSDLASPTVTAALWNRMMMIQVISRRGEDKGSNNCLRFRLEHKTTPVHTVGAALLETILFLLLLSLIIPPPQQPLAQSIYTHLSRPQLFLLLVSPEICQIIVHLITHASSGVLIY